MNLKAFFKKINSWENYVKAQDKLNSKEKGYPRKKKKKK